MHILTWDFCDILFLFIVLKKGFVYMYIYLYVQCGAIITWSIFFQILTIDTAYLAYEGKVWSVICVF